MVSLLYPLYKLPKHAIPTFGSCRAHTPTIVGCVQESHDILRALATERIIRTRIGFARGRNDQPALLLPVKTQQHRLICLHTAQRRVWLILGHHLAREGGIGPEHLDDHSHIPALQRHELAGVTKQGIGTERSAILGVNHTRSRHFTGVVGQGACIQLQAQGGQELLARAGTTEGEILYRNAEGGIGFDLFKCFEKRQEPCREMGSWLSKPLVGTSGVTAFSLLRQSRSWRGSYAPPLGPIAI